MTQPQANTSEPNPAYVTLTIEDASAAYDLFSYVSDHGGGERYPDGDCPYEREAPCPSL